MRTELQVYSDEFNKQKALLAKFETSESTPNNQRAQRCSIIQLNVPGVCGKGQCKPRMSARGVESGDFVCTWS